MPLHYSDLLDLFEQRAEHLGLLAPGTTHADTADLELYIFQALLDLIEMSDLPAYTTYDKNMAATVPGQQHYPLPDNFSRLILPRVQNRRGILLFDGARNHNLEYVEPSSFAARPLLKLATPTQFTVMGLQLWLFPAPDTASYTIRGTYILRPDRPGLDDEVVLAYPSALVEQALFRLVSDSGKNPQLLGGTRQEALTHLVAGSR